MQNLNGMELVALSIHVDETRSAREFKRFLRTNWRDVLMVVSVYVAVCASMLWMSHNTNITHCEGG